MTEPPLPIYSVVAELCLRCAACSTLAPGLVAMGDEAAVIVRQPANAREVAAVDAALFNCPVSALRRKTARTGEQPR
jgi:ferredoxin